MNWFVLMLITGRTEHDFQFTHFELNSFWYRKMVQIKTNQFKINWSHKTCWFKILVFSYFISTCFKILFCLFLLFWFQAHLVYFAWILWEAFHLIVWFIPVKFLTLVFYISRNITRQMLVNCNPMKSPIEEHKLSYLMPPILKDAIILSTTIDFLLEVYFSIVSQI